MRRPFCLLPEEIRIRMKQRRCQQSIIRYPSQAGMAVPAMTIPVKVEKLRKMAGGWLVLATEEEDKEELSCQGSESETDNYEAKEGEDYYIYKELPFWFNGKGIRSRKRSALYFFDEGNSELARITPKYLDVVSFRCVFGRHKGRLLRTCL